MKYTDLFVTPCYDKGIERVNNDGKTEICEGYFCEVYTDEELTNRIDYFCLAVGYEIPDMTEESLDKGIREYLGCE